jgi:hypothetical protein
MIAEDGEGWIPANSVVVGFDSDNWVLLTAEFSGDSSELSSGRPVTFSESRGTPVTRTPGGSSSYSPGSLFEIDISGLTVGMLVSGVGIAAAQSSNFSFKVSLSSKMPSNGIKIDITTKKDADGTVIESKSFESSSTSNDVSVGSLSMGVLYEISVVVTSKKTISNSAVKKFRVARKS